MMRGEGGGAYIIVAFALCMTINHASLARRRGVHEVKDDIQVAR